MVIIRASVQYHLIWRIQRKFDFRPHVLKQGILNNNPSSDAILAIKINTAAYVFTNKLYVKMTGVVGEKVESCT